MVEEGHVQSARLHDPTIVCCDMSAHKMFLDCHYFNSLKNRIGEFARYLPMKRELATTYSIWESSTHRVAAAIAIANTKWRDSVFVVWSELESDYSYWANESRFMFYFFYIFFFVHFIWCVCCSSYLLIVVVAILFFFLRVGILSHSGESGWFNNLFFG